MSLTREQIVDNLKQLIPAERVLTDEQTLQENSHDRFYKLPSVFGIYPLPLPAAVVKLSSTDEVSAVLKFLNDNNVNTVPKTGGSATEGGLETIVENSVVLDGKNMNQIIKIDPENMLATAQCGVILGDLEDALREQGYTMGHSPQSKPLAMMGGLTATRSSGQFSTLYGNIEDMIVGLEAVFPNGHIARIKNVSRRSCGPDIRHIIIGNEGALCYITEVTVKIHKYYPENHQIFGYSLDSMKPGSEILRAVMAEGYRPSIARSYDAEDGAQHGFDKFAPNQCVLILMAEGNKHLAQATANGIQEIVGRYPECTPVDGDTIMAWFDHLNWGPEKLEEEREFIRKNLRMGFTTEISGTWSNIHTIYENGLRRVREEFPHIQDITMLGGHSSHSYLNGTNMYFVYDYNVVDCTHEEEMYKYHIPINAIFVEEALKAGGSMVHHHGIGKHRTEWTKEEYGSSYYMLEALKKVFDPNGVMNKGTIFPLE